MPKLDDIKQELRETICGVYVPAQAAVTMALKRLADELVSETRRAASLDHRDALPGYFAALLNAAEEEVLRRIDGKRIDKERLLDVKERIGRRRQEGQTPLFDCLNEHLEGCAYELTNECKVWWSEPFPVNGETGEP